MGLLKSVDNVKGINYYEYRDTDYFNKFKYRARFKVPGIRFTYWAKNVDQWKKKVKVGRVWNRNFTDAEKNDMLLHADTIEKFLEFKHKVKKDKTASIRIENDTTAVFSNDLAFLHELKKWGVSLDFTEAVSGQYSGVKYFVNEPKYKYRVYLKSKRIEDNVRNDLIKLLESNKNLNPSRAFKEWLDDKNSKTSWRKRFLSSSYCIEYNDESTLSYLALMHGEILGRKYKLEKRPEA